MLVGKLDRVLKSADVYFSLSDNLPCLCLFFVEFPVFCTLTVLVSCCDRSGIVSGSAVYPVVRFFDFFSTFPAFLVSRLK